MKFPDRFFEVHRDRLSHWKKYGQHFTIKTREYTPPPKLDYEGVLTQTFYAVNVIAILQRDGVTCRIGPASERDLKVCEEWELRNKDYEDDELR